MKYIGNRISHQEKSGIFSIVIAASVEKYKENILLIWLLAWTLCGFYFILQFFNPALDRGSKLYLFVLLCFWLYYEYRITRILLWRKFGYESIKFVEDQLILKDVIKGRGKEKKYFLDNINAFNRLEIKSLWLKNMDNSFWITGNDYIHFSYQGKEVGFGKQLDQKEASELVILLNTQLMKKRKQMQGQINS